MSASKKNIGVLLSLIICLVLAFVALAPSQMAVATEPYKVKAATSLNAPAVDPDGFCVLLKTQLGQRASQGEPGHSI